MKPIKGRGDRGLGLRRLITGGLLTAAVGLFAAAPAGAETFTNPNPTLIPGTGTIGFANPYPTQVLVSGLAQPTTSVSITLTFGHGAPGEVGMVLEAPNCDALLIQGRAGDYVTPIFGGITYTLSDGGAEHLPATAWGPGTYQPTAYVGSDSYQSTVCPGGNIAYANPGPVNGGTATFASTFKGDPPNGLWRLYIIDFLDANGAPHSGGLPSWSLDITAEPPPVGTPGGSAPNPQKVLCAGRPSTQLGTAGPDSLIGTAGPDVISGIGGNDRISGLNGADLICGGDGKDVIRGGNGKDILRGEGGKDTLKGGKGKDAVKGGPGKDKQIQ